MILLIALFAVVITPGDIVVGSFTLAIVMASSRSRSSSSA